MLVLEYKLEEAAVYQVNKREINSQESIAIAGS
jgi:hypothetical protein